MVRIAEVQHARACCQCLAQIEEPAQPVAEICSASHDDAQFGERAIKPLCDISGIEYGTPLYAGAAPAAAAPRTRDLLGIVRTAQAEARRLINGEDSGSDLAQTKLDLPETLRVLEHALSQPAAVAGPASRKVFLVATGETSDGAETYSRHDDTPPPLCDAECLYTAPAAPALEAPAAPARIVADALIRLDAIYREEADCDEPPQRPDWLATALHLAAAAPQAPAAPWKDHLTARLVNDLRDCAIKYHRAGSTSCARDLADAGGAGRLCARGRPG
jgi:hypothetical protein